MKSRPARALERLVTHNFGNGTSGFRPADETPKNPRDATAVCVLPGTRLRFEEPLRHHFFSGSEKKVMQTSHVEGLFGQLDKEKPQVHHDLIDFSNGDQVYLTHLVEGQYAVVEALPAQPRTEAEVQQQKRAEYV